MIPKIGVADYGINAWEGGCFNLNLRLTRLKAIGYDGIEWLKGNDAGDFLENAACFHRCGMDFLSCYGATPALSLKYTSAFGKEYVWIPSCDRNTSLDIFCRHAKEFVLAAREWGVRAVLHNHMGCPVENQEELEYFLEHVPEAGLLLDTGHLAGAGGDCVAILEKYGNRLCSIHFKGVEVRNSDASLAKWWEKYRLCGLKEDTLGIDFPGIVRTLKKQGYRKWLLMEHDTHIRDPYQDLKESLDYLKELWEDA